MEAIAKTKYIRQSPFKIRFVADLVRGKNVFDAVNVLSLTNKKASKYILNTINSAVSNLNYSNEISIDTKDAVIKKIYVDGGPMMKRIRPRAQGRAVPIRKRMSHLTVHIEYNN
tara:strand:+ start:77 stop:418 length:342 start_codon:yes stop_codon:yes gene_type:complete